MIYSSAPRLAESSEERLWSGPGEQQSAGVKCCGQAEGRKVFINVLLAQGPTVPVLYSVMQFPISGMKNGIIHVYSHVVGPLKIVHVTRSEYVN